MLIRPTRLPCVAALALCAMPACSSLDPAADFDRARVVVTVKFKSRYDSDEVRRRYPARMPQFRALPGLIQKLYLYDADADEWAGIYLWESKAAVAEYLASDLRKSIPEAYGVVGQPRVESFEVVDVLR